MIKSDHTEKGQITNIKEGLHIYLHTIQDKVGDGIEI
jgi:hypothetical protein